jgi:two-component system chemotaxis response regulator CheV
MTIPNNDSQADVLLETGAKEIEIMEFTIAGEIFGINVAMVREIMMSQKVKKMPNSHEFVEGVFKPRDQIITVIDLGKYLGLPDFDKNDHNIFIITYLNNLNFAFHVESVVGIDRISNEQIKTLDNVIYGNSEGVAEYQNRLITILDFGKIIAEISPEVNIEVDVLSSGQSEENQ